jgi:transcriptional regulator with XRE-family HTH domain
MRSILHSQEAERPDVLAHLSDNLRRLRRERGISQNELADRAELSRRMLSSIEGGAANVSLSTVDRLAAALFVKFTDLVRPPGASDSLSIESVGWRGEKPGSEAVLLGAAPGSRETELWLWTLGVGERYSSEAGSENWHEMLFVTEGVLTINRASQSHLLKAGDYLIFTSRESYTFENSGRTVLKFIRGIVL